ncbi:hypothetical protein KAU45_05455, partial [bacterium]|nr:hypothetical protein [bacterium]
MRIVRLSIFIVLLCIVAPVFSGWGDWEETFTFWVCSDESPAYGKRWDFLASADYTRFSDNEVVDVPIIPERHGTNFGVNRLLYDEIGELTIDNETHDPADSMPFPFFATCTYTVEGTEYCAGMVIRCISDVKDLLTSYPVKIPDDPEENMVWYDGEYDVLDLGEGLNMIQSCDVTGDDSGNIHLVTAVSPWRMYFNADWTTELYYWRWHIEDDEHMVWEMEGHPLSLANIDIYRNPDMACDSEGNVHIVYSYNVNASNSDFGIGYCKITFDAFGQISSINHSIIVPDGTGVMCESPDITLDDGDNPHVVYQHDGGLSNNWNVYYTTKHPLLGWLMPTQVPAPMGSNYCWEPSIAICHDYVHVVYGCGLPSSTNPSVYTTANDRIFYTRKPLTGPIFATPVVLSDVDRYYDYGEWLWTKIFRGDGYANWNHNPCVIAGDDEISVIWVGEGIGYAGSRGGGSVPLTRRCR